MPPKKIDLKQITKPINSHFKTLTKIEIEAIRAQDHLDYLEEKIEKELDEKIKKLRIEEMAFLVNSTLTTNNMRLDVINTIEEVVQNIGNNVEISNFKITKPKILYKKRPHEWKEIAIHYQNFRSVDKTIAAYNLLETNPNIATWSVTLGRWSKDVITNKELKEKRIPVIGKVLDDALADVANNYFKHGVPMSDLILKTTLMQLMETHNRHDLLERCNPNDPRNVQGKKWFIRLGRSWCHRFYKRHNLSCRVATTKMRNDLPVDYEEKKKRFTYILSRAIGDNHVPDDLILNIDETAVQFVPSVTRTRCPKGVKRVRLIGIGMEKPQITVTFGASATGDILEPAQLIFGGLTIRCHPNGGKTLPPQNMYYDHTSSHWQTPESFITYITKTLLPYKAATITKLNLPLNQKMVLILDLHYSHKTLAVLTLLRANNIIAVFIPAGCTDLHQLCDVILNKSFKNGTKDGFVDYLSEQFISWASAPDRNVIDDVFTVNLALSIMKPLIPNFVGRGLAAINAEHMRESIRATFQNECLLGIARLQETYALAVAEFPDEDLDIINNIPDEVEAEEDLGPVLPDQYNNETDELLEEQPLIHQSFDVEVAGTEPLTESSDSDNNDSEDSEDLYQKRIKPSVTGKRTRMLNGLVGSVKKGKYSA